MTARPDMAGEIIGLALTAQAWYNGRKLSQRVGGGMTSRQQPATTDGCIHASQPHALLERVRRLALLLI